MVFFRAFFLCFCDSICFNYFTVSCWDTFQYFVSLLTVFLFVQINISQTIVSRMFALRSLGFLKCSTYEKQRKIFYFRTARNAETAFLFSQHKSSIDIFGKFFQCIESFGKENCQKQMMTSTFCNCIILWNFDSSIVVWFVPISFILQQNIG